MVNTNLAKGVIGLQVDSAAICKSMATTLTIVEKDAMGFYKEAKNAFISVYIYVTLQMTLFHWFKGGLLKRVFCQTSSRNFEQVIEYCSKALLVHAE